MEDKEFGLAEEKERVIEEAIQVEEEKPKRKRRKKKAPAEPDEVVDLKKINREARNLVKAIYSLREKILGVPPSDAAKDFLEDGLKGVAVKRGWTSILPNFPEILLGIGFVVFILETFRWLRGKKDEKETVKVVE